MTSRSRARTFTPAAVVVAAALVAGACTGGNGKPRVEKARDGGTLRVGVTGLKSLFPAQAREPTEVMVADQLFDTLTTIDPKTLHWQPGIAKVVDVNPQQTVFTFHLEAGLTFHDGTPLTSEDARYTLDRIAAKGSTSPLLSQLEVVQGYRANQDGTTFQLSGIETPDPTTMVVRLDEPFSMLPEVLAHPGFGIVPKHIMATSDEAKFSEHPVGSGPFRFLDRKGTVIRLARFRAHRPDVARADEMRLVSFDSANPAYDALGAGRLDIAPVSPERLADARRRFGPRGIRPYVGVLFYGMNIRSPKLTDVRLRKAIVLAVDRAKIIEAVYQDTVLPARGLLPTGLPGAIGDGCAGRCPYDPGQARALVQQVFPNGGVPEIQIDYDEDRTQTAIAKAIKAGLDAAGIPSALRAHAFPDYGAFLVSGQQELFRLGWIADYPSADAFLFPLFVSNRPDNLTGLANGDIDLVLRTARAEPDAGKRAGLFGDAEARILDQYVVLPIAQFETRLAARAVVRDLAITPLGTFDGSRVWLAGP